MKQNSVNAPFSRAIIVTGQDRRIHTKQTLPFSIPYPKEICTFIFPFRACRLSPSKIPVVSPPVSIPDLDITNTYHKPKYNNHLSIIIKDGKGTRRNHKVVT
jgi:hypothetical protein